MSDYYGISDGRIHLDLHGRGCESSGWCPCSSNGGECHFTVVSAPENLHNLLEILRSAEGPQVRARAERRLRLLPSGVIKRTYVRWLLRPRRNPYCLGGGYFATRLMYGDLPERLEGLSIEQSSGCSECGAKIAAWVSASQRS